MMVELLADIPGPAADRALARRAVVDLSPEVRETALKALHDRPREDARRVFLWALRYPWDPLADHAAEALVYLQDQEAVGPLVALLRRSDPAGPFPGGNGQSYVREVVRLHHEANCLVCHPAALTGQDPVMRSVPGVLLHQTPDKPTVLSAAQVPPALQPSGDHTLQAQVGGPYSGSQVSLGPLYVRADVTFFRQDFSISQVILDSAAVGKPRFDFMVRTRPARPEEVKHRKPDPAQYEQRDAVLWALRELTGKDPGPTTASWLAMYPRAAIDADAAKLVEQLLAARGVRRDQLISRLREGKGAVNAQALAAAIARLGATSRAKVRTALTDRLAQLPAESLIENLHDEDPEIRRAAALACASKGMVDAVAELEALAEDPEPATAGAARIALQKLLTHEAPADTNDLAQTP
jgi:hypothetical protein